MANDSENVGEAATANPTGSTVPAQSEGKVKLGTLVVQLVANDQIIASSQDPKLWQDVLAVITGHAPHSLGRGASNASRDDKERDSEIRYQKAAIQDDEASTESTDAISKDIVKFASDIEATPEEVIAACDPKDADPYLHLDHRAWEEMKKQTPRSGPHGISAIIPAATLLVLWFKQKKLGTPTVRQAQAVLHSLGIRDSKPTRGLKSREWLQLKDDRIVLNPARLSKALSFARAFCTQNWEQWNQEDK